MSRIVQRSDRGRRRTNVEPTKIARLGVETATISKSNPHRASQPDRQTDRQTQNQTRMHRLRKLESINQAGSSSTNRARPTRPQIWIRLSNSPPQAFRNQISQPKDPRVHSGHSEVKEYVLTTSTATTIGRDVHERKRHIVASSDTTSSEALCRKQCNINPPHSVNRV